MKNKSLPKSVLFAVAFFSLSAFLFVNIHAGLTINRDAPATELAQPNVESHNDRAVGFPVGTVIGRTLDIAHKLLSRAY